MLKYTGGGFIPDVPARDLTEDEAARYGGAPLLVSSGMYEVEQPKTKREVAKLGGDNGRQDAA